MKLPPPSRALVSAVAPLAAAWAAACSAGPRAPRSPADEGWVSPPTVNTRELTVLVKVEPPAKLRGLFEAMAERAGDEAVSGFFRNHASGSYGSGFLVARRASPRPLVFVVTNRHVVDLAGRVSIVLESGEAYADAEVVYADRRYDLAVLAFPEARPPPVAYGFPFSPQPARDQQAVTATGFPSLAGRPSYQTTRGYVSNERFELDEAGERQRFIQHTAPIGPGSSGGPLTTDGGRLVGVNTLKILDSDSAYMAVPAAAVADVVRAAIDVRAKRSQLAWRRAALVEACRALVAELGSDEPRPNRLEGAIASAMVGRRGAESFSLLAGRDEELWELFRADPADAIRWSIVRRLWAEVRAGGGVRPARSCAGPGDDASADLPGEAMTTEVGLGDGARRLSWRFEQGRWKVSDVEFRRMVEAPAMPERAVKKKKGGRKGRSK
jgi:serine protease Do